MTIKRKLFLITILPTITILLFSVNHIIDKYNTYNIHEHLLSSSTLMDDIASVLHEMQIERGLISSYISNIDTDDSLYFSKRLTNQQKKTDIVIKKFNIFLNILEKKNLKIINLKFTDKVSALLYSIKGVRKSIIDNSVAPYSVFLYFSYINSQLLELAESIKFYSNDEKTENNIMILKKLLLFQEISGQERGLVALENGKKISPISLAKLDSIWTIKDNLNDNIKIILHGSKAYNKLTIIDKSENSLYIQKVRELIKNSTGTKLNIDSKKWFAATSSNINAHHLLGHYIFSRIIVDMKKKNNNLYNSFIYQIAFTVITIFILLLGVLLIARNIDRSLKKLDNGMDDFFDFLNFKTNSQKNINTESKDELGDMADKINQQISHLQQNLENDNKFIRETTQIVQQMHNGVFHKKSHIEPASPYLVNLKTVFNKLTELISNKITEQTVSLEKLNLTLEDKVNYQTAELEKQIVDITNARDAAIKAEIAKDEFLANISHEIRTPLNAILGFVRILKRRTKDEESVNYLDIIDSSGKLLLNVINDVLDFSKIQSGKFTIEAHEIDPIVELSNVTLLFASKSYEKHLTYLVYIDPNLPRTISIDDFRLKQIVSNLLSNAIKFTPQDGVISVYIVVRDCSLIISVQDSGIGIPIGSQTKIFSAFSQADSSTTRKYGGTGLGLSISLRLAQLMNGNLTLVSQENVGSTFTLKIPIKIIDNSAKRIIDLEKISKYTFAVLNTCKEHEIFVKLIKKYLNDFGITNIVELNKFSKDGYDILFFTPNASYNEDIIENKIPSIAILKSNVTKLANIMHIKSLHVPFVPSSIAQAIDAVTTESIQETQTLEETDDTQILFSGHILVAEDNKTNQLLISLILDEYNIEHTIVGDGRQAVEIFKQKKFDLVLMDENMPELNGLGAMKQIKKYEKQNNLNTTPIIALTANALETDMVGFLKEGMDGFIAKPINNKLLEKELDKHLTRL